jgi:hypothetical protein
LIAAIVTCLWSFCLGVGTARAQPPSAVTNPATAVSATNATLNGTVNANGNTTTVTFEYGPTVAYGTTVTAAESPVTGSTDTAVSVSRAITGLANSTTYHFRVVAANGSGTTYGADMTFITGAAVPMLGSAGMALLIVLLIGAGLIVLRHRPAA